MKIKCEGAIFGLGMLLFGIGTIFAWITVVAMVVVFGYLYGLAIF